MDISTPDSKNRADRQAMPQRVPPASVTPAVRLVPPAQGETPLKWDNPLFEDSRGTWRLTGVAGSGVSTLLMDLVAKKIADGVDPASIAVIAGSKDAAARLRAGIASRVEELDYTSSATMVRSLHSLAFAIYRQSVDDELRLITGAEQDAVMRELLEVQAEQGATMWPAETRDAVPMVGFARGVRDFLLRAAERGVTPSQLEQWGEEFSRPMWIAAGKFMREYEQIMSLGGSHSLSASELVSAVLEDEVPDVGIRHIVVDDAQNLDPKSFELIQRLSAHAESTVVAGDPEQSVFRFRGANPRLLKELRTDHQLHLEKSHRAPATSGKILGTPNQQVEYVADVIRRAHLLDEVQWKDIAVVVRSRGMIAPIQRGLLAAGVPVHVDPTDLILSEQRIVSSIILAVRALTEKLTYNEVEELALGPIGGADPVTLRRLYRGLRLVELRSGSNRRAVELLRILVIPGDDEREELLAKAQEVLTDRELDILHRVTRVLEAGAKIKDSGSVEEVLWAIWEETGLAARLSSISLRGGAAGSQADRDLDAMMSLFDAAGDWVERRPDSSVMSFINHIREQELPTGVRDRRLATPQAVQLLTAHGTVGKQWNTVLVVGVQEETWPSLGETGSLFGQEELTDFVDEGIIPGTPVSRTQTRLEEEQRLFHVALTRATSTLIVTAVDSPDSDEVLEPSRFMKQVPHLSDTTQAPPGQDPISERTEGAKESTAEEALLNVGLFEDYANVTAEGDLAAEDLDYVRLLSVPAIVAELRRVVANPHASKAFVRQASRQLARLAQAGVPGAAPDEWWGARGVSEHEPVSMRALSPSTLESGLECPMRATLNKAARGQESSESLVRGNLVHGYFEATALGADKEQAAQLVKYAFNQLVNVPVWLAEVTSNKWDEMIRKLDLWIQVHNATTELVGMEVAVDVTLPNGVRIKGRIDRLDKTDSGYRIVDLKTGNATISQRAVDEHRQLEAYQLALRYGKVVTKPDGTVEIVTANAAGDKENTGLDIDTAVIVQPTANKKEINVREQARRTDEELAALADQLPELVKNLTGPRLLATVGSHCTFCNFANICPARTEGEIIPRREEDSTNASHYAQHTSAEDQVATPKHITQSNGEDGRING